MKLETGFIDTWDSKMYGKLGQLAESHPFLSRSISIPISLYALCTNTIRPFIELYSISKNLNQFDLGTPLSEEQQAISTCLKKKRIKWVLYAVGFPLYTLLSTVQTLFSAIINPTLCAKNNHPNYRACVEYLPLFVEEKMKIGEKSSPFETKQEMVTAIKKHIDQFSMDFLFSHLGTKEKQSTLFNRFLAFSSFKKNKIDSSKDQIEIMQMVEEVIHLHYNKNFASLFQEMEIKREILRNVDVVIDANSKKFSKSKLNSFRRCFSNFLKLEHNSFNEHMQKYFSNMNMNMNTHITIFVETILNKSRTDKEIEEFISGLNTLFLIGNSDFLYLFSLIEKKREACKEVEKDLDSQVTRKNFQQIKEHLFDSNFMRKLFEVKGGIISHNFLHNLNEVIKLALNVMEQDKDREFSCYQIMEDLLLSKDPAAVEKCLLQELKIYQEIRKKENEKNQKICNAIINKLNQLIYYEKNANSIGLKNYPFSKKIFIKVEPAFLIFSVQEFIATMEDSINDLINREEVLQFIRNMQSQISGISTLVELYNGCSCLFKEIDESVPPKKIEEVGLSSYYKNSIKKSILGIKSYRSVKKWLEWNIYQGFGSFFNEDMVNKTFEQQKKKIKYELDVLHSSINLVISAESQDQSAFAKAKKDFFNLIDGSSEEKKVKEYLKSNPTKFFPLKKTAHKKKILF